MRLLLDEMMPKRLASLLAPEIDALTVGDMGWKGKVNGELLDPARREFDALLTVDRSIRYRRKLPGFDLAVVVVRAKSSRLRDIAPLAGDAKETLRRARPGEVVEVG